MRICRVAVDDALSFGVIEGLDDDGAVVDGTLIALLEGHPFGPLVPEGRVIKALDARFVAPVLPSKVIAVDGNDPAQGIVRASPSRAFTLKPSTSVIGPGEPVCLPWQSEEVVPRASLAIVIGRLCRDVPEERVREVVFGYTCGNDITALDLAAVDRHAGRAKGFDSFTPLGPWIATDLEADGLSMVCTVNGTGGRSSSTDDMPFDAAALVTAVSSVMTLLPGDVILSGAPAGAAPLEAGDEVSVSITGIGTLTNPVIDRE